MTLYLYKTGTSAQILTIENVQSYTADSVTALDEDGSAVTYAPLAEDCELSGKADCSETLRAKWREEHPDAEAQMAAMAASVQSVQTATCIAFVTLAEVGSIDAVTASEHTELFAPWVYPANYKTGNIREHGGKLYRCLQDHTSQETWTPNAAPSLWVAISDPAEEWPEWSQPVGSTDAYAKGAKVTHKDKHWTSDVDNNVWEPGVSQWTEVEHE